MQKIKAWLLLTASNPFLQWMWAVGYKSAGAYYLAVGFMPDKKWFIGAGVAVVSAWIDGFKCWLQHQTANTQTQQGPSPMVTLRAKLLPMILLGFAFAMVNPASAYELKTVSAIHSGLDENMVVGIPTAALAVGTVSTSYGLSVSYSALWCHVKGAAGSDTSTLTSKFGVGASAYGDFGDWLSSNFVTSPRLKCGVGVILPEMCGITPGVMEVWDVRNGGKSTVVTMNVPLNLLNSVIVKLF